MLNEPGAARRIVEESIAEDRLTAFDRTIVGGKSVRIDFPLLDPVECYRHLELVEETCRAIRQQLKLVGGKDRAQLFMVRGMLRKLSHQLKAYRTPRRD